MDYSDKSISLKEKLKDYLSVNPLLEGVKNQYDKIAGILNSTPEAVRKCIRRHNLAPNVKINKQTIRKKLNDLLIEEGKAYMVKPVQIDKDKNTQINALINITTELKDIKTDKKYADELWGFMETQATEYIEDFNNSGILNANISDTEYIGLAIISDTHIGGSGCDYKQMREDAEVIRDNDYLRMIHIGDITDNFITAKIMEGVINSPTSPKQQVILTNHWFETMTYEKVLAVIEGNHDWRTKEVSGLDYMGKLIKDNKVFYDPYKFIINLHNPRGFTYTIYMRHKYRYNSAMNLTHAAKQLLRFGGQDADAIIVGHNHEDAWERFNHMGTPRFAIRPSTYKKADPYSDKNGYTRPSGVMPVLILNPYTKHMEIVDSVKSAAEYLNFLNKK